jgi:hypothetical protein
MNRPKPPLTKALDVGTDQPTTGVGTGALRAESLEGARKMPMKPSPNEHQDDFMHRCVPEMTAGGKRAQDQAVAACLNMWKEGQKSTRESGPLLTIRLDKTRP